MPQTQDYDQLRKKLFLIIMAFSLLPLIGLGVLIPQRFSTVHREQIVRDLTNIAENKSRAVDIFIGERVAQLKAFIHTYSYADLSDRAKLGILFAGMQAGAKSFMDLGVFSEDGAHVAYVGPYDLAGINYRQEPWFRDVMLTGEYVSDVFLGFRKAPHIIIAVMRREAGHAWILRATVDSGILNALVGASRLGRYGDSFLINSDCVLQTDSRYAGKIMMPLRVQPKLPDRSAPVFFQEMPMDGRSMLLTVAALKNAPWFLVVSEDENESFYRMFQTRIVAFLVLGAGVLIIATGAYLTSRHIVSRLMLADREKAQLDASLLQSSKMASLGKMAAGVAHEVNNPLMLIRENAGWIRDLLSDEDQAAMKNHAEMDKAAKKIEMNVDRASNVTHRMLGFARRMEPVREQAPLNTLVEQAVSFMDSEAASRGIKLIREFDVSDPRLSTDVAQLQQVVLNVVDNAIDATEKDGVVRVATTGNPEARELRVVISDSGPGIPADLLPRLFDPFFSTKKQGEGTGLGLAICHSIMEKLGGRIEAANQPEGGAAFTITLPWSE